MKNSITLGVNIDHVASLRQSRNTKYPEPVHAAQIAELSGADSITIHLREDRRHIQDGDVFILKHTVQTKLNLEIAVTEEMIDFAVKLQPEDVCLVPERREELTTEGGLDVVGQLDKIKTACHQLKDAGINVSPFIDARKDQINAVILCGAPCVEIHTGHFANATGRKQIKLLEELNEAFEYAHGRGLQVNAGHGLHYHNVQQIACNPLVSELNIGHSIIADAVFNGLANSVREMKRLMIEARVSGS